MNKIFIKQAVCLPILYFGTIIIASFFAIDYSQIGQHVSELAINKSKIAGTIFNIGIFITGSSLVLYGVGLLLTFKSRFSITSALIMVFGTTYLSGSINVIGSPWHDIYGIGISLMMLPFAFLYEMEKKNINNLTKVVSIISAILIYVYLWGMITRFDPIHLRGLTQRIFGIVVIGYIAYTAYLINKLIRVEKLHTTMYKRH